MANEDSRTDAELIAALNGGDGDAFDLLYYRHRDWVAQLAFRFTGSQDDALDVLQETFAYFHRKFPGFVLSARLTTFLYPVVRNLSLAIRRKRGRIGGDEGVLDLLLARENAGEQRGELAAVLGALSAGQREVLLARFVDEMSLEEIAAALEIPLGTVKSRIHNALATLRDDPRTRNYFLGK